MRAPPGSYEVSVTAPGMRQHPRAAPLEVHGDGGAAGAPRLYVLPLPVAPGRVQDIALLYAGDAEGRVLDPAQVLGGRGRGAPAGPPVVMLEAGGGASVSQGFAAMDSPVVRVRGSPGPGGAGTLSAWAPGGGVAPATAALGGWGAEGEGEGGGGGAERGPAVHAPRAVRAHEVFPASASPHAWRAGAAPVIDASGACRPASGPEAAAALSASGGGAAAAAAAAKREEEGRAGEGDMVPAGGLFVCAGDGRLSVFSGAGHGSIEVRPYARDEAPKIRPGFGGVVRAGGEYRIAVEMPPAPPGAPGGTVAVDTAVPHEADGAAAAVVLRPDRAGTFPVAVAASAPGYASASAILDVTVDASVAYSVEARGPSGEHLAVPVSLSAAGDAGPRAVETPHRETGERRAVTVEFPREARHGDRSYELVAARVRGADAGAADAGGGADGEGPAPSAVTAEPRDGDVFSASYARTVLVAVAGGAVGGGSFREGQPVSVSAPDVHVLSFLVREVWDGWDVRPAGGSGGTGPGRGAAAAALAGELDAQGRTASFAAADDVVVAARYREDHTGAAAAFAAGGMLAVLAVFRGAASYRLRAAQAMDSAEAALAAARAAARRWLPFLGGAAEARARRGAAPGRNGTGRGRRRMGRALMRAGRAAETSATGMRRAATGERRAAARRPLVAMRRIPAPACPPAPARDRSAAAAAALHGRAPGDFGPLPLRVFPAMQRAAIAAAAAMMKRARRAAPTRAARGMPWTAPRRRALPARPRPPLPAPLRPLAARAARGPPPGPGAKRQPPSRPWQARQRPRLLLPILPPATMRMRPQPRPPPRPR